MNPKLVHAAARESPSPISWRIALEDELHRILHWWITRMVDEQGGGFYGRIDGRGRLYPEAERGVIMYSRILWTFAAAARLTGQALYRQVAERAYHYFRHCFWDQQEGGVFWSVDADGQPLQIRKQIYAQAFAIYALAEYYHLTRDEGSLHQALEIFWLVERYSRDAVNGGYWEAFARNWGPTADLRLSEKDANEAKTMNTHLHVLEAYTNLLRVHRDHALTDALNNLIDCFLTRFIDPDTHHLRLFFDETWQCKSKMVSYGHDIECSWLLGEAAGVLGDDELIGRVRPAALGLAEAVYRDGLAADGALHYEIDEDGHLDTDRHWWPQAEAVVGFLNAYTIHRKPGLYQAAARCWDYINAFLLDRENGEWHWRVDQHGRPALEEDKAGPWKGPYHSGRMCMEGMGMMDRI